ncbi:MAG: NosD domain-containing protein [Candidatus Hodarchaeota archaeon]
MIIKQKSFLIFPLIIIIIISSFNVGPSLQENFKEIESEPPFLGDWVISNIELRQNDNINLNGSIIIEKNGLLNLSSTEVVFHMKTHGVTNGSFNITILDGGTLIIESGSTITTDDPMYLSWINISKGATIIFSDSMFNNLGYDLNHPAILINNASAKISNCEISLEHNKYAAISIYNSSGMQLLSNTISSIRGSGVYSKFSSNLIISNNNIRTNLYGIYINNFQDGYLKISKNSIKSINDYGLNISSSNDGISSGKPIISGNIIESAVDSGIYVRNFPNINILSNYLKNIKGSDENYGSIHLIDSKNAIVSDNYISNSGDDGIVLEQLDNALIHFNTIVWSNISFSGATGLNLTKVDDSVINSNTISSTGGDGIHYNAVEGNNITINSNVISNTKNNGIFINGLVDGNITANQLRYLQNMGLYCQNSSKIDVKNNDVRNSQFIAIKFNNCTDFNVTENYIQGNRDSGVEIAKCYNSLIQENEILENLNGISVYDCKLSSIFENYIKNTFQYGIYLNKSSQNNSIIKNIIFRNDFGIFCSGENNSINNNTIQSNSYGVFFNNDSTSNLVYFNDFVNNDVQAIDFGNFNTWSYNFSFSVQFYGNYWSDYTGQDQSEPYGFGDTPYYITESSEDFFPLMNINSYYPPPSIAHPLDLSIFEFTADSYLYWETSTSMKPSHYKIKVNGVTTLISSWTGLYVVYSLDHFQAGTYEITCIIFDFLEQSASDSVFVIVVTNLSTSPSTVTEGTKAPLEIILNEILLFLISLLIALIITIIIAKTSSS